MPTRCSSPSSELRPQDLASFTLEIRHNLVPRKQRAAHDEPLHIRVRARTEPCCGEQQADLHQVFPCLDAASMQLQARRRRATHHLQDPRRPSRPAATGQLGPGKSLVLVLHHCEVEFLLAGVGKVFRDDKYHQR